MTSSNDLPSRRDFLAAAGAVTASSLLPSALSVAAAPLPGSPSPSDPLGDSPLGQWLNDDHGLPAYRYAGPLRFPSSPVYEKEPMLPDDPYFLLGNYRLTLFAHSSGALQLLTGERAWGRMNQGEARFSGANQATVSIADRPLHPADPNAPPKVLGAQRFPLIGIDSPAALAATKRFGVGFARYDYTLTPSLAVTRRISVAPSTKAGQGSSAFLVEVRLRNTGRQPLNLDYSESILARYRPIYAAWNNDQYEVAYQAGNPDKLGNALLVSFTPHPKRRMSFPPAGQMSRLEQFPPALFVIPADTNTQLFARNENPDPTALKSWIGGQWSGALDPGQDRTLAFIIGYTRDASASSIQSIAAQLQPPSNNIPDTPGSAFADAWREKIPAFSNEPDPTLRREMRWNAAVLEQMANWREYYDETIMPQGTMYDYLWGWTGSMRDQAQHALPFCHFNPAIARSTLRFIMKRTLPDGNIMLNDAGFGWSPSGAQQTSDQQLYFLMLLAEYLRVTRDFSVLTEPIGYYPLENSGRDTGLAHVRQAFLFLRDRVGVGTHGIILRWNSDWNDMFGWWPSAHPYNDVFTVSESHMNSAMAIVILADAANALDAAQIPEAAELTAAMREYRSQLHEAFMRDLGDRAFPRRAWAWFNEPLGENEMWIEPQGFTLQVSEFPIERKRRLYAELEHRLLAGEAIGPRQIEKPVVEPGTPQGSRENGGFWYALNGPLILGVATFDRPAAEKLLRRMTFANYARTFPDYWTGQWSASDSLDSSLLKTNGLSSAIPWCAHAHAWPLYCWLRLRETA
jgi:cellobiose phosphorylase